MAKVVSIQGEQQEEKELTLWATDDEVDEFVQGADDRHLICRERGRHDWKPVRVTGLVFTGMTKDEFPERRQVCPDCQAVERVEVWDIKYYKGGKKRGEVSRCTLLSSYTHYIDSGYQNTAGHGRMKPRQIREAVGTAALAGKSYRDLMTQAREAQKAREAEVRQRQLALVAETA